MSLARDGFDDGLAFTASRPGLVIQGGDSSAKHGRVAADTRLTKPPPDYVAYTEGVVATAKGGSEPAGTAGDEPSSSSPERTSCMADYGSWNAAKGWTPPSDIEGKASHSSGPPSQPVVMTRSGELQSPS